MGKVHLSKLVLDSHLWETFLNLANLQFKRVCFPFKSKGKKKNTIFIYLTIVHLQRERRDTCVSAAQVLKVKAVGLVSQLQY